MKVFEFNNYKEFCLNWVSRKENKGRGQFRKMALYLNISPVIVSQVLKGNREFNEEQAIELCQFFGLSSLESDYFITLIKKERAGTHKLKNYYQTQIKSILKVSQDVKTRLPKNEKLTDSAKSIYYSNWYYGAVRLLTSIEKFQTEEAIANHLGLSLKKVREIIEFLLKNNLCKQSGKKIISTGTLTHIKSGSPLTNLHHRNWRLISNLKMNDELDENLFFTAPIVIDENTAEKIRNILLNNIESISKLVPSSPSKQLMCLNIDWFKF